MFVFIQQKGPDGLPITRLMTESGPLRGHIFRLEPPIVTVGQSKDNQIVVPLEHLDATHFEIDISGAQAILHDKGSKVGTFVNDEQVQKTVLQHGMRISFGEAPEEPEELNSDEVKPTNPKSSRSILLTEKAVESSFDDVRTVLGQSSAKWGSKKISSPTPKLHPPNSPNPQVPSQAPGWQERKLSVLLAVGKALSRPEKIEKKLERVLELLFETMDIDRAALMVLGPDDKPEEATSFAWSRYHDRQGPTEELELSSTIIYKVLRESVAVMTQDAQAEDWLDGARSVLGQAIRTCICTPLKTTSGVQGVLYADSSRTSYPFSQSDMDFFTSFSNQAAVSIENTRLLRIAIEKERLEQDLIVARRIQRWLYPRKVPSLTGFTLAGDSIAMEDVGGDYFDYVQLNERYLALIVGDVSGHGVSAALVMTMTRSILRGSLRPELSPAEILMHVNQLVSEDMITRMFVTMLLLVLDTKTGSYTFANAGHNPPIQYQTENGKIGEVPGKRGGPLGMSRWARLKPKYQNITGQLQPGDTLCLYTDGFLEAADEKGELMEMERFQAALLQASPLQEADGIVRKLFDTLHEYRGKATVTDDITAIVIQRNR